MDRHADGNIGQARGHTAMHGSVAIEQFLSNPAAQSHAIGVKAGYFDAEKVIERDLPDQLMGPGTSVLVVTHARADRSLTVAAP